MKRFTALLICAVLVFLFAACSKTGGESVSNDDTTSAAQQEVTATSQAIENAESVDNYTLGTLVTVNGDTDFKLKGLRLDGNRSTAENNGKDFATEGIRSGFFLDERISFYLDTDYNNPDSEDVKIICLPHRAFEEYKKMTFDEMTEKAAFVETFTVQEADTACFDPYVFSEDFGEGDYDVLFTFKGEIVYYLIINLTSETVSAE